MLEWSCRDEKPLAPSSNRSKGKEQDLQLRLHSYGKKKGTKGRKMKKGKGAKYTADLPRRLYSFFNGYSETVGAPSFSKFARSIGATVRDIEEFRRHAEFERAYQECNEIRRDYLIDNALCKRFDSSLTKFLLSAEFGTGEDDGECDNGFDFTLKVISGDEK